MPLFSYTYYDATGQIVQGSSEAKNEQDIRAHFSSQGLHLEQVKLTQNTSPRKRVFGRVKLNNLSLFCRQFSAMVDAGVTLVRCVEVLGDQTTDPILKPELIHIGEQIQAGESLSQSMKQYPKTFNPLFIGLIRAGEVGGVLDKVLRRLAYFLEKEVDLRRKVRAALTYPTLVLVASIGIVIFLVSWVVPQFSKLFEGIGIKETEFPAATKFLIDLSVLFTEGWYKVLFWVLVSGIGTKFFFRTSYGNHLREKIKLRMPVFGALHHKVCMTRFSRTLSTLLGSGVPILQAMETVADTVGNVVIADVILQARERIREGERIADPLRSSGWFPPMVVHMIHIGEESGSIDAMLEKVADFYDSEIDSTLQSLTAALEPIMIVVLGVIVLFIVIAMFMPAIQVMNELSSGNYE